MREKKIDDDLIHEDVWELLSDYYTSQYTEGPCAICIILDGTKN
jgi:hypothetical protein